MLQVYVDKLLTLLQYEDPYRSDDEKEKIRNLVYQKVLAEAESFVIDSLTAKERDVFIRKLDEATDKGDVDQQLIIMIRYLTEIPDCKYRIDARMSAMIASVHTKLLAKSL